MRRKGAESCKGMLGKYLLVFGTGVENGFFRMPVCLIKIVKRAFVSFGKPLVRVCAVDGGPRDESPGSFHFLGGQQPPSFILFPVFIWSPAPPTTEKEQSAFENSPYRLLRRLTHTTTEGNYFNLLYNIDGHLRSRLFHY